MRRVLVDGNNVLAALGLARGGTAGAEAFLQKLEMAAASKDWEATVVFDGPERFLSRPTGPLVVRYAAKGQTADSVIERAVYETADRLSTVVVTQDQPQADLVRGLGAVVWTPRRLLEEM
ncbi:MAG: NYN domain-containing protein [Candidatus Omnitrophica bacterium]|nr:NYN domain-containing protein [Candidatus Omnitrophota bacterium]